MMIKPKVSVVKVERPEGNDQFLAGKYVRVEEDIQKIKAAVGKAIELSVRLP